MAENKQAGDIAKMSFEQALGELEAIVSGLETGDVPLDKSISQYERGEALRAHCQKLLQEAEGRVEKIRLNKDGETVGTEPLDPE